MRIIVTFSGGKDSLGALLWVRNNMTKNFTTVFCDTGWESEITYQYLDDIEKQLGIEIVRLKSKKYAGMIDLAEKKKRFPSSQRRFCTSELKSIPMIDYLLDEVKDDFIVIQGIRGAESESRSKMNTQCNYFKYYLEPYEINSTLLPKLINRLSKIKEGTKKYHKAIERIEKIKQRLAVGKEDPKFHTYRRKEVLKYCEQYATDVFRPVFDWSAQQVIDYILDNGFKPNPLYSMGMKRVGCFPCIMIGLSEIHQTANRFPQRIDEIAKYETEISSSFFGPKKIPSRFYNGGYPLITDVVKYAQGKYDAGQLFDDYQATSCMSYYGLCE